MTERFIAIRGEWETPGVASERRYATAESRGGYSSGKLPSARLFEISEQLAYGFRDVHDHLVRLSDEAMFFQDRITSILDAHLSAVSNSLNQVMKVLTVLTTVFMPLTLIAGLWGMNIALPHFPGGDAAQFWWLSGIMVAIVIMMLALFRRNRWI